MFNETETKPTGGASFELPEARTRLRDEFAGQALSVILKLYYRGYIDFGVPPGTAVANVAKAAYEFADAMLKARQDSTIINR